MIKIPIPMEKPIKVPTRGMKKEIDSQIVIITEQKNNNNVKSADETEFFQEYSAAVAISFLLWVRYIDVFQLDFILVIK